MSGGKWKKAALERTDYLRNNLEEYRKTLTEQSISDAKDAILFSQLMRARKEGDYEPHGLCLAGFDNLDRIVAEIRMAIERFETAEEFVARVSQMTSEERLTSDEPIVRSIALLLKELL